MSNEMIYIYMIKFLYILRRSVRCQVQRNARVMQSQNLCIWSELTNINININIYIVIDTLKIAVKEEIKAES